MQRRHFLQGTAAAAVPGATRTPTRSAWGFAQLQRIDQRIKALTKELINRFDPATEFVGIEMAFHQV